ncbi:MAG: fibronectin type III domain-containing protein [Candidatus Colwellbacteria bacterium]|nr:fibronectin type III domain-containing protein [Candidatus Colwellbacteria bacterium]
MLIIKVMKAMKKIIPIIAAISVIFSGFSGVALASSSPSVVATEASSITSTSAYLKGYVDPNGSSTEYWIEYGTNNDFQYSTIRYTVGSSSSGISVGRNVTGLTAGKTYQYKLIAKNASGTNKSNVVSFTTTNSSSSSNNDNNDNSSDSGNPPSVAATSVTSKTSSAATLNGSVDANGKLTEYWIEYGTNNNFQYSTIRYSIGSSSYAIGVSRRVTGLSASTTYQYKVIASNSAGKNVSNVVEFTTSGSSNENTNDEPSIGNAPSAVATGYSSVTSNSANISGSIDPNGLYTEYWAEYGTNNSFSSRTSSYYISSSDSSKSVNLSLSGLSSNTVYKFKFIAKNSKGSIASNVMQFTTSSSGSIVTEGDAPSVSLSSAYSITKDSAVLSGSVNPNSSWTEYWFEYGTNSNSLVYSTPKWSVSSTSGNTPVSSSVYNLQNNTTYYYRLVANNSYGTRYSSVWNFITQGGGGTQYNNPYVVTRETTEKYSTSAVLNADVSPNGYQTDVWFEYGYSNQSLNRVSGSKSISGNSGSQRVSIQINNLSPNTYYDFRAVARTSYGTFYGDTMSFRTSGQNNGYYGEPQVVTIGVSNVLQNVAVLEGSVNPNGSAGSVWFEYGTSAYNLNNKTTSISVPSHIALKNYYIAATGLSASTTYYYRVVCSNAYGTKSGEIKSFKTSGYWKPYSGPTEKEIIVIKEHVSTDEESGVILDPSVSNLEPKAGDTIDYVLTYRNASKKAITGASLKVTLPFETEYVNSNVKPTSQMGNNLVFYIGDVEKGSQGVITIKAKINEDTAEGSSIMFNSFLEYTDGDDDFQTVNSYIAVMIKGSANIGFLGSLSSLAKSLSGSWLMLILLLLMFVTIIYLLITRKKQAVVENSSQ